MTTYKDYQAAQLASATLKWPRTHSGSAGIVGFVEGYGPWLPRLGSSSSVIDQRPLVRRAKLMTDAPEVGFRAAIALTVVEQLKELVAALSLNKSQLAQILQVTRPTVYEWFQGKEPNATNTDRVYALLGILARSRVSGAEPLNARFIRQPTDIGQPSLIELLSADPLDADRIVRAIEQSRALADSASQGRRAREERLRALGYDEPSDEQIG